jgi:hypothetical protein
MACRDDAPLKFTPGLECHRRSSCSCHTAHHMVYRSHGGDTNLDNLVHHRAARKLTDSPWTPVMPESRAEAAAGARASAVDTAKDLMTDRGIPVRRKPEISAGHRHCCFRQRTAHQA